MVKNKDTKSSVAKRPFPFDFLQKWDATSASHFFFLLYLCVAFQ